MIRHDAATRRRFESLDADALAAHQLRRFNALVERILPENRFYAEKLAQTPRPLGSLEDLSAWPLTYKEELVGSASSAFAKNLTWPRARYSRLHQTSGTSGRPLVVLDSRDDWQWWLECWQYVFDAAEVDAGESVLLAFSFGPFIGFWSAYDAAAARGCLVVPTGSMATLARLELIRSSGAKALLCTPSYALHMAEVARQHSINTRSLGVRAIIVAGEPGGSLPNVRGRIEEDWNATVIDHAGATEVGPWGFGDRNGKGLFVLETEFIAEFLSVDTGEPADEGQLSHLILTSLGRPGAPIIRYRTGDLVRPSWRGVEVAEGGACHFVFLDGGVLGRADDMVTVRGVNVFPSSIDQIIRGFPEVIEYRVTLSRQGELDHLQVEVEDRLSQPQRIAAELRVRLGLRVETTLVEPGTLPRFDGKGKRFIDERKGKT
jgi:phenylacetate-CoA ligase